MRRRAQKSPSPALDEYSIGQVSGDVDAKGGP